MILSGKRQNVITSRVSLRITLAPPARLPFVLELESSQIELISDYTECIFLHIMKIKKQPNVLTIWSIYAQIDNKTAMILQ